MKAKRFISFIFATVCLFMLTIPSFATENRASAQIALYEIVVTPTAGTINVKFTVSGSSIMNKIGCESIEVYEKSGSSWDLTESWDEDDNGMSLYNSIAQRNTIYCNGEAGVEYKVVVTIFAENDAGRDTRTRTVYVTGK